MQNSERDLANQPHPDSAPWAGKDTLLTIKSAAWAVDTMGCCHLGHNGIHLILSSPLLDAWHKAD